MTLPLRYKYSLDLLEGVSQQHPMLHLQDMKYGFQAKLTEFISRHPNAHLSLREHRGKINLSYAVAKPHIRK